MEQALQRLLWVLWPHMSVREILQMRTAAQAWNDASVYGSYCELFFCLMKRELADGEVLVGISGLRGFMRPWESRVQ